MSRQILVLGNHRSGSSALAGVLSCLGVPTGPQSPAADPLTGAFEDDDFVRLFTRILGSWRDPQPWMLPFRQEEMFTLERLVRTRDTEFDTWFLKAPRLAFMLPVMTDMLSSPCVVWSARDLNASVSSLVKRDNLPQPVAALIASRYHLALLNALEVATTRAIPTYKLAYEDLVAHPHAAIARLVEALRLTPNDLQIARAIASINPSLKHF